MELKIVLFVLAGALLGLVSDRLAARWPRRQRDGDDEAEADAVLPIGEEMDPASSLDVERPFPRPVDWRTPTMVFGGALAFGALGARWNEPRDLLILGAYFTVLTLLMANDLDRRVLPDVLTLPMIPIALVLVIAGLDPLLQGKDFALPSAFIAAVGAPLVLAGTSLVLRGGIGMGDLKLAVTLGLMSGITRLFTGFLLASAASSVLLVALLASRRLSLKSAIPFGPVLIAGAFVAALLPA